jgi:small-conductance mechanosensitive channel
MFLGAAVVEIGSYFFTFLNTPFLSAGDLRISIVTLIAIIPMVYLANGFGNWTRKVLDKNVFDRMGVDPKARFSIGNLARYAAMTVFFLIGLSIVGISFSSLTALFAVFGVGIGFGLQTMVANFIAGLIIIMTRPIKQGDFIKAVTADGAYEGTVTEIKMIYTVINTLLNETIVVPNSAIVDNSVHNYSYDDWSVVYPVPIQVHYESDLDQVKQVLYSIGTSCPFQKSDVEPTVQVYSFDESGITMRLLLTLSKASDRSASRNYTNEQIWRRFKAEGIEFPYPQMDVHLRKIN